MSARIRTASVAAFACACLIGFTFVEAQPAKPRPVTEPDGTPAGMAAAAKLSLDLIQKQQDLGEAVVPSFIAIKAEAAKKLLTAEREVARERNDPAAEVAALEAYVGRARETHRVLFQRFAAGMDASEVPVTMAATDLAEAKMWLARAKAANAAAAAPPARPAAAQPATTRPSVAAERLAVAREAFDAAREAFDAAREAFNAGRDAGHPDLVRQVADFGHRLAEAARDSAVPPAERLAALREVVARNREFEAIVGKRFEAGTANRLDVLTAKLARLEAERWLEQAEAGK